MDYQEYIQILERLHKEYFSIRASKEYSIGTKFVLWFNAFRNHKIIKQFKQEIIWRKIAKYDKEVPSFSFEYGTAPYPSPKIAVYTCITGGYDAPLPPLICPNNIDYILFTDDKSIVADGWIVKELPHEASKYNDNTLRNRYCKMHPSIVGSQYQYAIYIDGNIQVYSDVTNIVNAVSPKTGIAIHRHNCRNCIYDEVKVCELAKRGNIPLLKRQVAQYKANGMPRGFGLLECTIIVTDLRNNKAKEIMSEWWKEFLNSSSKRDQIALPYVLWKMGYKVDDIGNLGWDLIQNPKFKKIDHLK